MLRPAELGLLHLNIKMKPLDDKRVRQAIAHAINQKQIVSFKGDLTADPPVSVVPAGYLGTDARRRCCRTTSPRRRRCSRRPGSPNGITVKSIQSTLPSMLNTAQILQAQLKQAGIDLQLEVGRPPDLPRQHPQGPQRRDLLHGGALPGRRRAI